MSLVVVIPSVQGEPTLGPCLRSLAEQDAVHQVVVVADGAPHVVPYVRRAFPGVRWCLELAENRGFCAAANAGLSRALDLGAEWILLLNDDTLLEPGCLSALVAAGEANPATGLVAPLLLDAEHPERIDSFGLEVNLLGSGRDQGRGRPLGDVESLETEVAAATGGALLIRRAVLEEVGLLDEAYGFYFEDVDLCLAAQDQGWQLRLEPSARLRHQHSASVGDSPRRAYYLAKNQVRLVLKTFPLPHLSYALPLSVGRLGLRIAGSLAQGDVARTLAHGRAALELLSDAPRIVRERRPMHPETWTRIRRIVRW